MIDVDTNVIAYLLIQGEHTKQARVLYDLDRDWIVPTLWRHEFLNVLVTYVRHGGINLKDAQTIWEESTLLFVKRERPVSWEQVMVSATENKISAYDAQFVTLAAELQANLITEDKQLQNKIDFAVSISQFLKSDRS